MSKTFIDAAIVGAAQPSDIDAWLARWHGGAGRGRELHEFLGLTWGEYARWAEGRLSDEAVVARAVARRNGTDARPARATE